METTPTPELVALLELSEMATPGVWCALLQGTTGPVVDDAIHAEPGQCCNGGGDIVCNEPGEENYPASQKYWEANAKFIAALVNWFRSTRAATVPQGVSALDGMLPGLQSDLANLTTGTAGADPIREALAEVIRATRAYLPPDGISPQDCIYRVLAATDNARINAVMGEIE